MATQIRITIYVLLLGVIIGITAGYSVGYLNYQPLLTARTDQITQLEDELTDLSARLQANLTDLHADVSALTTQLEHVPANYSITNLHFAAGALPFNVTSRDQTSTNSTTWTIIPETALTITTPRNAALIILFSSEVAMTNASFQTGFRISLNGDRYLPNEGGIYYYPVSDDHFDIVTFTFSVRHLTAGTHRMDVQWVVTGSTGFLQNFTLIVFALPA